MTQTTDAPVFSHPTRLTLGALVVVVVAFGCSDSSERYQYGQEAITPYTSNIFEESNPDSARTQASELIPETPALTEPEVLSENKPILHYSPIYSPDVAQVTHLLIKGTDTDEETLDVDAAIYNRPNGRNLGLLACSKLPGCNNYVMDIAQQNVAVYEVRTVQDQTWARISDIQPTWAKVQPPLKLVSFEEVGQLVEPPRQATVVCVLPGVGCSEMGEEATEALRTFRAAQLNAITKILLLATGDWRKIENFAGIEESAALFGYESSKVKTIQGHSYVSFELPSLREVTQALDALNNKDLQVVSMKRLARAYPTEYNAYVDAKSRYQKVLGRKYMWIRTRDAQNIPTVYAKTGE